jgi:hypothetical protein
MRWRTSRGARREREQAEDRKSAMQHETGG